MNDKREFYENHMSELREVRKWLADLKSVKIYDSILQYRTMRKRKFLRGIISKKQYFDKEIVRLGKDEVFVDCGAYIGDTLLAFAQETGGFKKAYLFEPDTSVRSVLEKNVKKYKDKVCVIEAGAYSHKAILRFCETGMGLGTMVDNGDNLVSVETIDEVVGNDKVTFIKMDIEGSELEALKGAENTIKRDKPKLAICIYHKDEDFYMIPKYIRSIVPEYKMYVRHYSDTVSETVLYAVF